MRILPQLLGLLFASCVPGSTEPVERAPEIHVGKPLVIPRPQSLEVGAGQFTFGPETRIYRDGGAPQQALDGFLEELALA
ncbi:MAG: hypothetical protein AAF597_17260, partial [Bacteroidota bacterium]